MKSYDINLDELPHEERDAVVELRQRMKGQMEPELYDEISMFHRFLKARNFNLNASEEMMRKHLIWRKLNQVDTILTDFTPSEVVEKYLPLSRMGFDKEGSPILYSQFGNLDSRGLIKSVRRVDVMKVIVKSLEIDVQEMKQESMKRGKRIDKWIYIFNFENFSLATATHKATLEILGSLVTMYEANYPERLKVGIFINASLYFTLAWSVIKPFLSGPTVKKVKIFGKEGWQEELLKIIDADTLPKFLGGNRTDPDGNPLCKTVINHGGQVPESYYIYKDSKSLSQLPGVRKLSISRMSKTDLPLHVIEPGSTIEWEFETKSKDIGFALLYQEYKGANIKELIPNQRIDTMVSAETGTYLCDKAGIYTIQFDNSYSWMHHKEVYCKAVVIPRVKKS
ncbi:SEC14-like protein 2 [Uloborus diversus]|uniref:SEC14-like protein 2 n=1 Tax=Uloborus diversus TaxID=327109 RepID=UPI00240994BA|nr:SEC14-like protein 2 [Uloborus diversus]XP_054715732.1 SEC14-like protein 2 [Uloborus diversus]XP_054715733.1 SEC14-like protein 2 [Uloborus diversus]